MDMQTQKRINEEEIAKLSKKDNNFNKYVWGSAMVAGIFGTGVIFSVFTPIPTNICLGGYAASVAFNIGSILRGVRVYSRLDELKKENYKLQKMIDESTKELTSIDSPKSNIIKFPQKVKKLNFRK